MRISRFVSIAALVLAPVAANAQTPVAKPATDTPTVTTGWVDFGIRGTDMDGDGARYERYRDLSDGLFMDGFKVQRQTNGWFMDFTGAHTFAKDQRLVGSFVRPGQFKLRLMWDQIPMLMSRTTQTLFTGVGTKQLFLSDLMQSTVQNTFTAGQPVVLQGFVGDFARPFELSSHRHIGEGKLEYIANSNLTLNMTYRRTDRQGLIPFGGSFGHSNVVEVPVPISHTLQDVNGGAEWMRDRLLVRVGYTGSFFHNDYATFTYDNPWRAVDSTSASSMGRASLPPSSNFFGVNGTASVTMPHHTRATAYVSMGSLKDAGVTIMPYTINTALTGINPFPRTTVNGEGRTTAANLTFTSRPNKFVDVSARYRTYDYENRTPDFTVFQRVSYDNSVSTVTTPIETEPFGIVRRTFDADFRTHPVSGVTAGGGYSRIEENRSLRFIPDTVENVARLTFDAMSNRWFTLRTKFEHSQKRGTIEDEELRAIVGCPAAPAPCDDSVTASQGLEHLGTRPFDISDRDRNRFTVLGTVIANEKMSFGASLARGTDNYLSGLSPETPAEFGLRSNNHWIYGGNFDVTPTEKTAFGLSYTHEHYKALQYSRQSNPQTGACLAAATCQFIDPSKNWVADGHDNVNGVIATLDVQRIRDKVDLRFSADYNRSTSDYNYLLGPSPELTFPDGTPPVTSTLASPSPLPLLVSELRRGTVDLTYSLTPHVDLGASYWYERYRVQDFTLDDAAIPRLTLTGALLMGYTYRPYTANTVFGRLIVRF